MQSLLATAAKTDFPNVRFVSPEAWPAPATATSRRRWLPWAVARTLALVVAAPPAANVVETRIATLQSVQALSQVQLAQIDRDRILAAHQQKIADAQALARLTPSRG